jgi:hypothetical protein
MRINKYFGTIWFVIEGKNTEDDDRFSLKIENLYKIKPKHFQVLSFENYSWSKEIVILNIGFSFYN